MTILCDVDGVCADMLAVWLARYNADYSDALTPDRVTAWDVSMFVKPECGKRIFEYLHSPTLYEECGPVRGALDGVTVLREMGHRVVFVTSCVGPEMVHAKIRWLFEHGFLPQPFHVGMRDLVIMQDKGIVKGDVMIDDYEQNLHAFGGRGILLDCAYNRHDQTFTRARSWHEIVSAIA